MQPFELTASQAASLIERGDLTSEDWVRSCLARIAAREPLVRAWACIDRDLALRAAREIDTGRAPGPLRGVPVGFKDLIATADMPTSGNSAPRFGERPSQDADAVTIVKHAGGLVLGKTETVEFGTGHRKPLTRNPHEPGHTPGGSSSGSAAAVADHHVPIAVGTQTGGSVIRPATFCGVYALKPSYGLVSNAGIRAIAPSFDTVGWFSRCVEDLQRVAAAFHLPETGDAGPTRAPREIRVGLCRTPAWQHAGPGTRAAIEGAARRLAQAGVPVTEIDLPDAFARLPEMAMEVIDWEARWTFLADVLRHGPVLSDAARKKVFGSRMEPAAALAAMDSVAALRPRFDAIFAGGAIDVILAPAAPGEAPGGLLSTGDAIFNTLWTALHVPCVAIPAGRGEKSLPVGVQLVGPRFADRALLRHAAAIAPILDPAFGRTAVPEDPANRPIP